MTRRIIPLLFLLGSVGCEGNPSQRMDLPRLVFEEDLRIGTRDLGPAALTVISDIEVDADGHIFSAHPQEAVVRIFGADGGFLGSLGRPGSGPKEFRGPGTLGWKADTLWIFDGALRRFTLVIDNELARTVLANFPPSLGRLERGVRAEALLPDGSCLAKDHLTSFDLIKGEVKRQNVVRLDPGGHEILNSLLSRPFGRETWLAIQDPSGNGVAGLFRDQPFEDFPVHAISPSDTSVIQVHRKPENEGAYRIIKIAVDGDTLWDRTVPWVPEQIPEHVVDSVVAHLVHVSQASRGGRAPTVREQEEWVREALYLPTYFPAVEQLVVGREGRFLVSHGGSRDTLATLFDERGIALGRARLPPNLSVLAIRNDALFGTTMDEFDVPYLVRLRLRPRQVP